MGSCLWDGNCCCKLIVDLLLNKNKSRAEQAWVDYSNHSPASWMLALVCRLQVQKVLLGFRSF